MKLIRSFKNFFLSKQLIHFLSLLLLYLPRTKYICCLIIASYLSAFHITYALCNFSSASFNITYSAGGSLGEYNPFDNYDSVMQLKFELDNIIGSCNYIIALSDSSSAMGIERKFSSSIHTLNYNLYTDPGYSKHMLSYNTKNIQGTITGSIHENIALDTKFAYVKIPKLQEAVYQAVGYSDHIQFDIYQILPNETFRYEKSATLNLKAKVKSVLNFALTKQLGVFSSGLNNKIVEFDIVPNQNIRKNLYFVVQNNTPYRIFLSSANNMKLIHEQKNESYINYQLRFNKNTLNLTSQPLKIFSNTNQNMYSNYAIPMEIIVPSQTEAISGKYEDVIHITLQAQ